MVGLTPRRVLLADDHSLVRGGIRSLLDTLPGYEVVGEVGDGLAVPLRVREQQPDILLLDISMPGLNGLEALGVVRDADPAPIVIMLSMHHGSEYVARALDAGAAGYLVKDSAVEELAQALDAVCAGRRYLSPGIDVEQVEALLDTGTELDALELLTQRQRQILQLIVEGHSTRDIAEALHVSAKTVETHRAHLMDRLGIHDVAGLVRFAIRVGLVDVSQ